MFWLIYSDPAEVTSPTHDRYASLQCIAWPGVIRSLLRDFPLLPEHVPPPPTISACRDRHLAANSSAAVLDDPDFSHSLVPSCQCGLPRKPACQYKAIRLFRDVGATLRQDPWHLAIHVLEKVTSPLIAPVCCEVSPSLLISEVRSTGQMISRFLLAQTIHPSLKGEILNSDTASSSFE